MSPQVAAQSVLQNNMSAPTLRMEVGSTEVVTWPGASIQDFFAEKTTRARWGVSFLIVLLVIIYPRFMNFMTFSGCDPQSITENRGILIRDGHSQN